MLRIIKLYFSIYDSWLCSLLFAWRGVASTAFCPSKAQGTSCHQTTSAPHKTSPKASRSSSSSFHCPSCPLPSLLALSIALATFFFFPSLSLLTFLACTQRTGTPHTTPHPRPPAQPCPPPSSPPTTPSSRRCSRCSTSARSAGSLSAARAASARRRRRARSPSSSPRCAAPCCSSRPTPRTTCRTPFRKSLARRPASSTASTTSAPWRLTPTAACRTCWPARPSRTTSTPWAAAWAV